MIKTNIQAKYNHQFVLLQSFNDNIFVADYTEQTKSSPIKRGVELFSPLPPSDIDYFSINNRPKVDVCGIPFDNNSFVHSNGNPKSQCEAVFFPDTSNTNSWILFCELKYSHRPLNNTSNLRKAIKQLFKTRYYYFQDKIISINNTSYLIASLPMQREPFANFALPPSFLIKLKSTRNIVLRLKNSVEIANEKVINI
jgi:hypothetical protein